MKSLLKKLVLGSAFLGTSLSAQDRNISVSVDGVSYNCAGNGGGGGAAKLYCNCEIEAVGVFDAFYFVNLRKIDLNSGTDTKIRRVSDNRFYNGQLDLCKQEMATIPVCRL